MSVAENNRYSGQAAEFGNPLKGVPVVRPSPDRFSAGQSEEVDFSCYHQICAATDFDEFKQLVRGEVNNLGFSDYSFVRLNASDSIESQSLVTLPQALLSRYYEKRLYEHDVILEYAENSDRPIFRSTLDCYIAQAPFVNSMTRATQSIRELCKSFDYHDFYNIPVHGKNGSDKVMLSITDRRCNAENFKSKVESCKSLLLLLCESIDWATAHNFAEFFLAAEDRVVINQKPLQVLRVLANSDLNISQVADNLCISVVTANKHLETVRKAFGVRTNYAAIKKAVTSGLIEYQK